MAIHQTELLHETKNGYTLWCTSCRDIQLGFGNMLLVYSLDGFKDFKQYVDGLHKDTMHFDSPMNRNIYMRMSGLDFGYCLSAEELVELKELLSDTIMAIMLKEVLQETLSNTN